jgi:pre-mRNA-processing factor 17
MDLLSSYDDDSAPSVAAPVSTSNAAPSYRPNSYIPTVAPLASAQSRALVVSAAPSVSIDHSTSGAIQPYMSAQQKVVFHNPTADMMWAPLAGPVPQHSSGMATNTLTGFVESHQLDAYQFDAQYHTFQSRGYAANPSMLTGASTAANTAEFIGKASSHAEMNGATVFDASTKAAQREANHGGIRKRKAQGDASEPSTYLGPWAPYEIEDIEKAEYAKAKTEREAAKKLEEEARKADAEEDDGMGGKRPKAAAPTERTLFHGDSVHDYQGRTYMSPPSELRPEEHSCHIPENLVHTWSGHTKGVNAIRFFPNYGHLLLSGSLDSTVKIWDVYGKRKCLRSYLGHSGGIRDIQFSHDGRQFLSTSFDKYIKLWDTETGQCVQRWTTGKVPFCAQWHGDIDKANEFLTGMQNKKVLQWDARAPSDSPTQEYDEHLGAVNAILFVDNNRRFVSCADDKKLLVWHSGCHQAHQRAVDALDAQLGDASQSKVVCRTGYGQFDSDLLGQGQIRAESQEALYRSLLRRLRRTGVVLSGRTLCVVWRWRRSCVRVGLEDFARVAQVEVSRSGDNRRRLAPNRAAHHCHVLVGRHHQAVGLRL